MVIRVYINKKNGFCLSNSQVLIGCFLKLNLSVNCLQQAAVLRTFRLLKVKKAITITVVSTAIDYAKHLDALTN